MRVLLKLLTSVKKQSNQWVKFWPMPFYFGNAHKINKPGIKSNDKIGKNLYYDYRFFIVWNEARFQKVLNLSKEI